MFVDFSISHFSCKTLQFWDLIFSREHSRTSSSRSPRCVSSAQPLRTSWKHRWPGSWYGHCYNGFIIEIVADQVWVNADAIIAANLYLGAFHHILVLRDRVGHHDRLETAVVYPACRVRVKYETILSHLVNQEQLGNISLLPTWRGPPHWRCREWE